MRDTGLDLPFLEMFYIILALGERWPHRMNYEVLPLLLWAGTD